MNSKAITYTVKVDEFGTRRWFNAAGQWHREDGPACEYANGDKFWLINDKLHRTDGPACEYTTGNKQWYINGQRHRTDGPAIEYANGDKEWWINGKYLTEGQFNTRNAPCSGKTIEVDGKKYELKAI